MTVCPNCRDENPDHSPACRACGALLTPGSGATVVSADPKTVPTRAGAGGSGPVPPPAPLPPRMVEPIAAVPPPPPTAGGKASELSFTKLPAAAGLKAADADPPSAVTVPEGGRRSAPPAADAPAAAPQPRLRVVRGERVNVEFLILTGRNLIGRSADKPVDIDLIGQEPEERVWASRQHAAVTLDRGVLVIEDLNSLNGTFVNRQRIHPGQGRVLQPGDIIQVGTVQMRVEVSAG